jgi:hypothetical protein
MESMRNQWARAAQAVQFTKRPQQRTSLEVLQRLLEHRGKDNESLVVVEIGARHCQPRRVQMNRHMLLNECRKDVKLYAHSHAHSHVPPKKESLSRSSSREDLFAAGQAQEPFWMRQQVLANVLLDTSAA